MERYEHISSIDDLKKYHFNKEIIGSGAEGTAYLIDNNKVLKVNDGYNSTIITEDKSHEIIMRQDYNLRSFMFPEKLFICNGEVVAYLSEYFGKNKIAQLPELFNDEDFEYDVSFLDLDQILKAREKMIEDTRVLSNDKIMLFDLCYNLLFDGKRLGAIDTLDFYRNPDITLDENIEIIDRSILIEMATVDESFQPDFNVSIEKNFRRIRR